RSAWAGQSRNARHRPPFPPPRRHGSPPRRARRRSGFAPNGYAVGMPDLTSAEVAASLRDTLLPILLIVVFAVLAMRLATLFVHGIVKTLLDREATEGTAQELSAVELKKRMDTLDGFAARTIQFVI